MDSSFIEMSEDHGKSKVDQEIDANLKRVYSGLLDEDVPDRFKELLEKLRAKESKK